MSIEVDQGFPLNLAVLDDLSTIMEEAFPDLLIAFLEDAKNIILAMQQAVADSNVATASQLAHALKGSSANIGAVSLSDLCEQLNQQQREGQIVNLKQSVDAIAVEFHSVRKALIHYLENTEK